MDKGGPQNIWRLAEVSRLCFLNKACHSVMAKRPLDLFCLFCLFCLLCITAGMLLLVGFSIIYSLTPQDILLICCASLLAKMHLLPSRQREQPKSYCPFPLEIPCDARWACCCHSLMEISISMPGK